MKTFDDVKAAVEKVGLGHRWTEIESLIRPAIHLTYDTTVAPESLPVGASRIGGWPDLPPDMVWPMFEGDKGYDGHPPSPMLFLAQINLADIAELEPRGILPPTGIVYFFACVWMNAIYPRGEEDSPVWAVRYFDGDPATLRPNVPAPPFPEGVELNYYWYPERNGVGGYHYNPVAFRFQTYLTLPVWYDKFPPHPYLDSLKTVNTNEYHSYQKLSYLVPGVDPPVHQMLGWSTGDSRFQLGTDAFKKVMLLQLDSNWIGQDSPSDFNWENSGCAWFLITPEALVKREFETAEFVWATT